MPFKIESKRVKRTKKPEESHNSSCLFGNNSWSGNYFGSRRYRIALARNPVEMVKHTPSRQLQMGWPSRWSFFKKDPACFGIFAMNSSITHPYLLEMLLMRRKTCDNSGTLICNVINPWSWSWICGQNLRLEKCLLSTSEDHTIQLACPNDYSLWNTFSPLLIDQFFAHRSIETTTRQTKGPWEIAKIQTGRSQIAVRCSSNYVTSGVTKTRASSWTIGLTDAITLRYKAMEKVAAIILPLASAVRVP